MSVNIVIVGGGFGGLESAFSLKDLLRSSARITVVDRSEYHSFIPSIHEIISGKLHARDIQLPLAPVLGVAGIEFLLSEVLSVDITKRQVMTAAQALPYDYLVIGSGAENNFYDVAGAESFSYRFRSPEDAERIRRDLGLLFAHSDLRRTVTIAGGGTEGVEVAGELIDSINNSGYGSDFTSGKISLEIIEGRAQLLPDFAGEAGEFAKRYLLQKGVAIVTGDRIKEVRKDTVILESGVRHDVSMLIWTGGIQPTRLIREIPLRKDPQGWLVLTDRLHCPESKYIYGMGDAVSIYANDTPLPVQRLAYHALDQALVVSLNIYNHLRGRKQVRYSPKNRSQLISMGKEMGIFIRDDTLLSGRWVILSKEALQVKHLMTYLTKPGFSAIASVIPGAEFRHRMRILSPL
jgi:NADH dehydrogenase